MARKNTTTAIEMEHPPVDGCPCCSLASERVRTRIDHTPSAVIAATFHGLQYRPRLGPDGSVFLVDEDRGEAVLAWNPSEAADFLSELMVGPAGCELSLPIRSGTEAASFVGDELAAFAAAFEATVAASAGLES